MAGRVLDEDDTGHGTAAVGAPPSTPACSWYWASAQPCASKRTGYLLRHGLEAAVGVRALADRAGGVRAEPREPQAQDGPVREVADGRGRQGRRRRILGDEADRDRGIRSTSLTGSTGGAGGTGGGQDDRHDRTPRGRLGRPVSGIGRAGVPSVEPAVQRENRPMTGEGQQVQPVQDADDQQDAAHPGRLVLGVPRVDRLGPPRFGSKLTVKRM